MNSKLAVGLSMFLGGLGTQLATVDSWSETFTTVFVSGFIIQVAGFILSVWGGIDYKPPRHNKRTRHTDYPYYFKDE